MFENVLKSWKICLALEPLEVFTPAIIEGAHIALFIGKEKQGFVSSCWSLSSHDFLSLEFLTSQTPPTQLMRSLMRTNAPVSSVTLRLHPHERFLVVWGRHKRDKALSLRLGPPNSRASTTEVGSYSGTAG